LHQEGESVQFDYDYIVIGSGFGGSVSALRLAQKGYKVAILECGRRFADHEFAEATKDARKYYWAPHLGLRGVLRMTLFKDVFIVSGCGVGGGSLGYANTLYRALPAFYRNPQWADLAEWETELKPHYDEAERMLGVTQYDRDGEADVLLKEFAQTLGVEDSYVRTPVGVYFGQPGQTVSDPYFGGEGPDRTGCVRCGGCMVGCRYGAKNTLPKNYLWFAEKLGVTVLDSRTVSDIEPLGGGDGGDGYVVTHHRSGGILRRNTRQLRARGVVVAAGALGTNRLLQRCKVNGSLPRLSDRLGYTVRTNSESIVFATAPEESAVNFANSVAITSSIHTDESTHIEVVTYGTGGDSQGFLRGLLVEGGGRGTRPLFWLMALLRHPLKFLGIFKVKGGSRRTIILLVMQTLDNSIRLKVRRRLPGGGVALTTEQDPQNPNPDKIPVAYQCARWFAERIGGEPYLGFSESMFAIPVTAHILGGAVIGEDAEHGVVDSQNRVFGYRNLLVTDGAALPANVGANPSLTITAVAERAMTFIPEHG
jgi:cholesterol oxidase